MKDMFISCILELITSIKFLKFENIFLNIKGKFLLYIYRYRYNNYYVLYKKFIFKNKK